MNEREIRKRLKRYKNWRRDRSQKDYVGPHFRHHDADWLVDELERQLDRNNKLDKQLTELKEAGEPFEEFVKHFPQEDDNSEATYVLYAGIETIITVGEFRRLAEALKEVKDE